MKLFICVPLMLFALIMGDWAMRSESFVRMLVCWMLMFWSAIAIAKVMEHERL